MKITMILIVLLTLANAEQYHPLDEMETFECYAEYGTNCEEAEEYEADKYEDDSDDDSEGDEDGE